MTPKQTPHIEQGKENPTGQENLDLASSCDPSKPMKTKDFTQVGKKVWSSPLLYKAIKSIIQSVLTSNLRIANDSKNPTHTHHTKYTHTYSTI